MSILRRRSMGRAKVYNYTITSNIASASVYFDGVLMGILNTSGVGTFEYSKRSASVTLSGGTLPPKSIRSYNYYTDPSSIIFGENPTVGTVLTAFVIYCSYNIAYSYPQDPTICTIYGSNTSGNFTVNAAETSTLIQSRPPGGLTFSLKSGTFFSWSVAQSARENELGYTLTVTLTDASVKASGEIKVSGNGIDNSTTIWVYTGY